MALGKMASRTQNWRFSRCMIRTGNTRPPRILRGVYRWGIMAIMCTAAPRWHGALSFCFYLSRSPVVASLDTSPPKISLRPPLTEASPGKLAVISTRPHLRNVPVRPGSDSRLWIWNHWRSFYVRGIRLWSGSVRRSQICASRSILPGFRVPAGAIRIRGRSLVGIRGIDRSLSIGVRELYPGKNVRNARPVLN